MRGIAVVAAAIVTVLAGTCGGAAQTLAVQSGEHEGFTRLVLRIGVERDWTLTDQDRTVRLSVSPGVDRFDLSRSFDLIPRTRIAELRADGGDLAILLGCDCPISSFRYLDEFLVIDVADPGTEPPPGPLNARDATQDPNATRARAAERASAAAALPDLARILTAGPSVLSRGQADTAPTAPPLQPQPPAPPEPTADIEEATRIMAEQLARAAAAGLLTPARDTSFSFADPIVTGPETNGDAPETSDTRDMAATAPPDVTSAAPRLLPPVIAAPEAPPVPRPVASDDDMARSAPDLPLRLQSALDPDRWPTENPEAPAPPLACAGTALDLAAWSAADDFMSALGDLRLALFDDRDRLVDAAALNLIRHYLAHGFGAEAAYWLDRINAPPADLVSMAALIEGRMATPPYGHVDDTAACSDAELLLRYLAGSTDETLTESQADRVQRGFSGLPAPLQRHFGPDLARRLTSGGQTGTARNIRDALERSGAITATSLVALDLEIGIEVEAETARRNLAVALRDDGASPVPAMVQALALDRTEHRVSDPARITAAEGLLRETPPGAAADTLWREIVTAQMRVGQVDTAMVMLAEGREAHSDTWQQAVTEVLSDRLEQQDTATLLLLAHLFGNDWTDGGSQAGRVRMGVSRHLRAMGLDMAADVMLANGPGLILPRPEVEPDAGGQHALWTGGNWVEIASGMDGPHADIASRMARRVVLPERPPPEESGIDLDTIATQIADSGELRRTIDAVLSTRLPDGTP